MRRLLAVVLITLLTGHAHAQFGVLGRAVGQASLQSTPCDLIGGCVAAHSVTRRLLASYSGNLFQLSRTGGGGGTTNIGQTGTNVDTATLSTFCGGIPTNSNGCAYHQIYDHTGNGHVLIAVHCDVPITFDSNNLPTVTTGAAIASAGLPCFLNDATGSTPSGGVDASMYAVAIDGAIPNNASCGFYGLYHATASPDTPGTDLGLIFRQDVAGHRGMGFDLEEEVIEAYVGTYSADSSTGFAALANPAIERRGRFVGIGSYTQSSQTLYVDMNGGEQTYSWVGPWTSSGGSTTSNTGGEIRMGAGGDGCATEAIWQEGAIWGVVLNATQRQALTANVKAFYNIPTAPVCSTVATSTIGVTNATAAWGLRIVANNWAGALAVVHTDSPSAVYAVMGSGCDIDVAALSALCAGTTCEPERLDNQVQTGHLEDYRQGSGDPWHMDQPTFASAPTVTFSCAALTSGRPCLTFSGSQQLSAGSSLLTLTRPYSLWVVGKRTSGTNGGMLVFSGSQPYLGGGGSANQALFQSSSMGGQTVTAADGTYFARIGTVPDSTHVTISVNGTRTTSGVVMTADASSASAFLGNSFTGTMVEAGIGAVAISSGNDATIATNQCSYWGFATC